MAGKDARREREVQPKAGGSTTWKPAWQVGEQSEWTAFAGERSQAMKRSPAVDRRSLADFTHDQAGLTTAQRRVGREHLVGFAAGKAVFLAQFSLGCGIRGLSFG